jgi:hypothetical protein
MKYLQILVWTLASSAALAAPQLTESEQQATMTVIDCTSILKVVGHDMPAQRGIVYRANAVVLEDVLVDSFGREMVDYLIIGAIQALREAITDGSMTEEFTLESASNCNQLAWKIQSG